MILTIEDEVTDQPVDSAPSTPSTTLPPIDRDYYEELVRGMVVDNAPSRFAIVQDYGDRANGWVAAWGLAFGDGVQIIDVDGHTRFSLTCPDLAIRVYTEKPHITARVIWVDPEPESEE